MWGQRTLGNSLLIDLSRSSKFGVSGLLLEGFFVRPSVSSITGVDEPTEMAKKFSVDTEVFSVTSLISESSQISQGVSDDYNDDNKS